MTQSMQEVINPGDIAFTIKNFKGMSYTAGDIVAFQKRGSRTTFVKRIRAISNDTIFIKRNYIHIKKIIIPHDPIFEMLVEESNHPDSTEFYNAAVYSEYLLNRSNLADQSKYVIENGNAIIIPEDYYFMIGDNHYESMDSRFWGFIPKENIKGKVVWVF